MTPRCPTCHSDDPAVRCILYDLSGPSAWVGGPDEYECTDPWHNDGRKPDFSRYAEHVKNGAGWKEPLR